MVNKYESIGIFFSVAVMALALFLLRVETSSVASVAPESNTQSAVAVVAGGEDSDQQDLFNTLAGSVSLDGDIQNLIIDDITIGTGVAAEEGDTISVHYIGTLDSGQQFDNSYLKGVPFTYIVGDKKVIEGWDLGVVGMKIGGQRILVIPPELAYGNKDVGPIPANSTLVFAIELLEIN